MIFTGMKTFSVNEIKKELERKENSDLLSFCIRLAKFKKENKELLGFLLFDADDISTYVENVKLEMDASYGEINKSNVYYIKKSIRKILRNVNKHIRFISSKQAEVELLIHFCNCFFAYSIPTNQSRQLTNIYESQLKKMYAALSSLHPDLQYDFEKMIKK